MPTVFLRFIRPIHLFSAALAGLLCVAGGLAAGEDAPPKDGWVAATEADIAGVEQLQTFPPAPAPVIPSEAPPPILAPVPERPPESAERAPALPVESTPPEAAPTPEPLPEPAAPAAHVAPDNAPPPLTPRQRVLLNAITPELLETWDTDIHLTGLTLTPTVEGNAGPLFKRLETLYLKEKIPGKANVPPEASGVDVLVEAASMTECRLTPDSYPCMDDATKPQPDYIVYIAYVRALVDRAEAHARAGRVREAEQLYRAGLQCGRHLTNDRSNLITFMLGLAYKQRIADYYARFLRNQLRYEEAGEAELGVRNLREKQGWLALKAQVLLGDFKQFNCLPATIRIALEDAEPCWRQEAIYRLGVLRHGAPWGGDLDGKPLMEHDADQQRQADEALRRAAESDAKPWIRDLALWSIRHLTPERFNEMRHKALLQQNAHLEQ